MVGYVKACEDDDDDDDDADGKNPNTHPIGKITKGSSSSTIGRGYP